MEEEFENGLKSKVILIFSKIQNLSPFAFELTFQNPERI
jgi:hypothetical protein